MVERNRFTSRRSRIILVAVWWIPGLVVTWFMWSAFSWGGLLLFVLPFLWVSWDYIDWGSDFDVGREGFAPGDWQVTGLGLGTRKRDDVD